MNFEITSHLAGAKYEAWKKLIESAGLVEDSVAERTILVYDEDELIAAGSRDGYVLKYIAVSDSHRGEDITARLLTELRRDAFDFGYSHLFLYTKPENRYTFESLFFYPICATDSVLVMENKKGGISELIDSFPKYPSCGVIGSAVMNCNPFTNGHKALIEQASRECDHVYVFVLSEEKSDFSFIDRLNMVKLGTAELKNVTVLPTGPYLISSATFPTYFLKDRERAVLAAPMIDVKIFAEYFAKGLGITRRYVGTEPNSPLTASYNSALKAYLPPLGIDIREVERVCADGVPISAGNVRDFIKKRDTGALLRLVPKTTLDYLITKKYL